MKLMIEPKTDGAKEATVVNDDYVLSTEDEAARCYLLTPPPEYANKRTGEILAAWRAGLISDPMRSAPAVDDRAPFCILVFLHNSNGVARAVLRFSTQETMTLVVGQLNDAIKNDTGWVQVTDDVGGLIGFQPGRIAMLQAVHMPSYAKAERAFNTMQQLAISS